MPVVWENWRLQLGIDGETQFSFHLSWPLDTEFMMEILFLLLLFNRSTDKPEKDFLSHVLRALRRPKGNFSLAQLFSFMPLHYRC